jgi:hypothetical protein
MKRRLKEKRKLLKKLKKLRLFLKKPLNPLNLLLKITTESVVLNLNSLLNRNNHNQLRRLILMN